MAAEKLRLSTDFGELRTGMSVVYRPCHTCSETHRFTLLNLADGRTGNAFGGQLERGYVFTPALSCYRLLEGIGPTAVATRRIYIVDTGNDDATEQEEGRKLYSGEPTLAEVAEQVGRKMELIR